MIPQKSFPRRDPYQTTSRILRFLVVASILLPIAVLAAGSWVTWETKQREAWDKTARLVDLIHASVSKLFDAQLLVNEQVSLAIGTMDDARIKNEEKELHDRLNLMLRFLPHTIDVFLVNADAHAVLSSLTYPAPATVDLRDRDYFQFFKDGGTGLFVGKVAARHSDGQLFFSLAIRRPSPDGRFTGVIVASVGPEFLRAFFKQAANAYDDFNGRAITLRRDDGELLVRVPDALGPDDPDARAAVGDQLRSGASSGHFVVTGHSERGTRLIAWRRLANVNMAVFSGVTMRSVVVTWVNTISPHLIFGVPATLSLLWLTLVALGRTKQAEAAAQQAEEERNRRERAEEAVRQGQKMEALGKLTGGVAHDFNNLLAVILGSADLAKARASGESGRLLDNILHAAQRGATLTRQLLSFSRAQALQPKVLDPHSAIPSMMDILKPSLRGSITTDVQVADDVWLVEVDPGEWEIALLNIVVNARDVMPDGGRFTVQAGNRRIARGELPAAPDLQGTYVSIALTDTGPGIPPDVAARAFEPFYTTKDVGKGTGLGLSQVYGFAKQAGGAATIAAGSRGGTTVTLYLPRTHKQIDMHKTVDQSRKAPESGNRRILLVEDNLDVAAITIEIMQAQGYEVVHEDRARKALARLMQAGPAFHLLVTDVVMPDGMDGLELARTVRARLPALPIIVTSGYNDVVSEQRSEFRVLRKPLPAEQLMETLRAEISTYPRVVEDQALRA